MAKIVEFFSGWSQSKLILSCILIALAIGLRIVYIVLSRRPPKESEEEKQNRLMEEKAKKKAEAEEKFREENTLT